MADLNVEDDEYCFACGSKNTIGLHLDFKQVENSVVCEFVADKLYQGYAGILLRQRAVQVCAPDRSEMER